MTHSRIISENELDNWVRGNASIAQGVIVELVYGLVAASSPRPKVRRFPLRDSIGQPGPDGVLDTDFGFDPFVPKGRSFWEIGTGTNAGDKATEDYRDLTEATPEAVRRESTFVFVTPLSGRRDWAHTWKTDAQASWLQRRLLLKEWLDVRVIDGSGLIDWLHQFLAVELWLADEMGIPAHQIRTPEQRWRELETIGEPPPLPPALFLANRDDACEKLKAVLSGTTLQLKLDTRYPGQVADFVAAYIGTMDEEAKIDAKGRCLIISGTDGWEAITALSEAHILVADFDLHVSDSAGTRLLEKARRAHHAVIFWGMPGGIPHPNRASISNPKSHQVKEALEKAGYKNERARILAQKCDGNLNSLIRCLQHLSIMPEWAQDNDAAELAIAELLGGWSEGFEADKAVAEKLSGKAYGEWIGTIRDIAFRPGTPLIQRENSWKFVARYEGWYSLGPRLFDEHLDRLKEAAVTVLCENDPKFELPSDKRFASFIYGKSRKYSHLLRDGLAESLALVGSHHNALTSCSSSKAETTAILAVREILEGADWLRWASLNEVLPLLAEAAPREFLGAVESALSGIESPFDSIFAEEGDGVTGSNYMTGLLWALETLAWDSAYLTRVVVLLGDLASRDPGGNWGNRPAHSLTTILLPWFPQTCASVSKRKIAVATLLGESPDVAWKLLLALLPDSHQISMGSRRPAWREIIPDDWTDGVTHRDLDEQWIAYAELAISAAKRDLTKLTELIERLDDLPSPALNQVLAHLGSATVIAMSEADRLRLWTEMVDLVSKHRKFAETNWAMLPDVVDEIAAVAGKLAPGSPIYRHQRLFSQRDFDLYEETGNFEEQHQKLEKRRQNAIEEVFAVGGIEAILEFAKGVESPGGVGIAFGLNQENEMDKVILPALLETETKSLVQFAGGYVWSRFRACGWQWVDGIDTSGWKPSQTGLLLAYLPFTADTWERAARLLGEDQSPYWSKTSANPYEAAKDLEYAIERLVEYGRPYAAIGCLNRMLHDKQTLDSGQAIRVLQAVLESRDDSRSIDQYSIREVFKSLQGNPATNSDDLSRLEWAFLPFLNRLHGASPKHLERRLADDPAFFCELIRIVFRSKNVERPAEEPSKEQSNIIANAFRLLNEWKTPPGSTEAGTYDGEALNNWLKEVKTACAESGHLEVALSHFGQVLVYAPPDPDGLWLHHSAAKALNDKEANDVRDGFRDELFNSRGVFWASQGQEERKLAVKYRTRAEEVESRGYHRLASSLKLLADSYERDADRAASSDDDD